MNQTNTQDAGGGSPSTAIDLATLETLKTQLTGTVLHITLNRPEVRNAMSLRMVMELRAVLADAECGGAVGSSYCVAPEVIFAQTVI